MNSIFLFYKKNNKAISVVQIIFKQLPGKLRNSKFGPCINLNVFMMALNRNDKDDRIKVHFQME